MRLFRFGRPRARPADPEPPLDAWFHVSFDETEVTLDVAPPGGSPWRQSFAWSSVIRVCFKPEEWASDGIYVFTRERPESYAVPVAASGGAQLLDELIARRLFGAEMAIEAASATEGLFCWPEDDAMPLPDQAGRTPCRPPEAEGKPDFDARELAAYLVTRLPDRGRVPPEDLDELLAEIAGGGLKTLDELDGVLKATREAVARFEADMGEKGHGPLVAIGVVRVALRIFDVRFFRAAAWRYTTEEGLAASDAEEYAGYRHLVKRTSG